MRRFVLLALAVLFTAVVLVAATKPNFAGSWQFAPKQSKNAGMMGGMTMLATIEQTPEIVTVTYDVGEQPVRTTQHFDLSGKPVENETQMGGHAETTSELTGEELVTTWTSKGAVAETKVTRTETWTLNPEGNVLTITSARGTNAPVVMVFEKRP